MARDLGGQIEEILTTLNPEMENYAETRERIREIASSRYHALSLVRTANDVHTREIERAKHRREMEVSEEKREVEEQRRLEATRMNEQLLAVITTMQAQQETLLITLRQDQEERRKLLLTQDKRARNVRG